MADSVEYGRMFCCSCKVSQRLGMRQGLRASLCEKDGAGGLGKGFIP
jgi:hypothetical protein